MKHWFRWYRKFRGGRWARVTGWFFGKRWVRVPDDCRERVDEDWSNLRWRAIVALRKEIPADDQARIREAIAEHGSDWVHHLYDAEIAKLTPREREAGLAGFYAGSGYFRFGRAIRNFLRGAGFGEKELGVDNLDDVYVELIEKAVSQ